MELSILKWGQTGMGILVEYDAGFISPSDERNQNIIQEFKKLELTNTHTITVYAVLQKYGVKNRNGRVYGKDILVSQNEIYQQAIRQRRAFGELDHPTESIISLDRIALNIVETWWEGHTLMGKIEIPMTRGFVKLGIVSTKGDLLAHYLEQNYMIGVSSRGVGSLKEVKGDFIVQDDFEIIGWDAVTAPSTPGSWIFKNKEESKPYVEHKITKKPRLSESLDNFLKKN
jgi:hypothetical protein